MRERWGRAGLLSWRVGVRGAGTGIWPGEVKPATVLIGERGTAKLADCGIAKAYQPSDGGAVTATAMVVGTPSYLAPERAEGAPAGVASDLWAVGVVLYEALT